MAPNAKTPMIAVNSANSLFDKMESRVPDKGTIGKYPSVLPRAHPLEKQLPGTIPVCSRQRRHNVVFDNHSVEGAVVDFFSSNAYHCLKGPDYLHLLRGSEQMILALPSVGANPYWVQKRALGISARD
jgi:hypothetical protein